MISLTNHDFQWGRSEVVIIFPDIYINMMSWFNTLQAVGLWCLWHPNHSIQAEHQLSIKQALEWAETKHIKQFLQKEQKG